MLVRSSAVALALLVGAEARAEIDPRCQDLAARGTPDSYNEVAQQDFLQNYFALSTTLSPLHAPVPLEGGQGSIGIDLNGIPPLGCRRRLVLAYSKTESTNKSPVAPRLRVNYSFAQFGRTTLYAGFAYTPPIRVAGVSAVILSGELGVGAQLGAHLQLGARFHATSNRTVAEIATPFVAGDDAYDDLFISSTFGVDGMLGWDFDGVVTYASFGFTDASTFFYVGDDSVTVNNFHPYFGPVVSVGADAALGGGLRVAGEGYAAPGGYSLPNPGVASVAGLGRYGRLYTVRVRVAYDL